ncbi:hypothetical protein HXX76_010096 [Chlamydomonas incerta]|uniref:protein O-GlcNAc transferase n=1 Tax=Chlamydomonas incerta TaxID=51695 RepID=A0A835SVH1_CHLIN|nr:hypothetical protein HXX76_010096 [Chlamydomonas incerta]|eukprot:KAG2430578.1 hypothetical protein HXX76_010096 [Chlamydomonas incerta]
MCPASTDQLTAEAGANAVENRDCGNHQVPLRQLSGSPSLHNRSSDPERYGSQPHMPSSYPDSPASPNFRAQQQQQQQQQLHANRACEASPEPEQAACEAGAAAVQGASSAVGAGGRQEDVGAVAATGAGGRNPTLSAPSQHVQSSALAQSNDMQGRQQQQQQQRQQRQAEDGNQQGFTPGTDTAAGAPAQGYPPALPRGALLGSEQPLAPQHLLLQPPPPPQQQQQPALAAGPPLPLLAAAAAAAVAPVATLSYTPWGPVLPVVEVPAAPGGAGAAAVTNGLPSVLAAPAAGSVALPPFSPMATGTPVAAAAPVAAPPMAGGASAFAAVQPHIHVLHVQAHTALPGQQGLAQQQQQQQQAGAMGPAPQALGHGLQPQVLNMHPQMLQLSAPQQTQPLQSLQPQQTHLQPAQQQSIPFPPLAHQFGPSVLLPPPQLQPQLQPPQQLHLQLQPPQPQLQLAPHPQAHPQDQPPQPQPPAPAGALAATALAAADADATAAAQCRLAAVLRAGGKPAEAAALLDLVLVRQPGRVEALYQRAVCQQALGQAHEAQATYLRALAAAPDHTPSLTALGALYQAQGLLGEAVAAYRRAHELRPEDGAIREGLAVVLTDQGTKLKNAGAPVSEAVSRYQAAAALCPSYAPALYNLGVVAGELRQADASVDYYRAAIAAEPRYAQAHCNLGVLLRERGRLPEAVAAYEAALAAAPNFTIVRNNLAIALTDLGTHVKNEGRLDDGISLYERALSYAPRHADALYNLGVAYGEKGDLQRAAFMYEMALAFNPACAEAHNNLGVIAKERDNVERAVECYSAALAIRPHFPQSLNNLGVVLTAQGRAAEALALLSAAVAASPTYTEAHNNLGVLQRDVGCIPEALASYTRCLELDPACRNAGQNRLLALNYIYPGGRGGGGGAGLGGGRGGGSGGAGARRGGAGRGGAGNLESEEDLVCSAHREWGERFQAAIPPLPPPAPRERGWDPERPLRIGYISPDLFTHSVSYFSEAPLSHHSPARGFTHIVYSCVPKPDSKTARLRAATEAAGGVWRDAAALTEAELAEAVRADGVDLLLELTGHTANNRLGVMARRPAPVQATWIGYPNSTGLAAVDYRITDAICDPYDTKQTFVEELVRLPGCFLCYTPAADAPPVSPPPCLHNGYITFGSFNNLAKITPQVLRVWAAILAAVPRSRLVLKNKPFACEAARSHLLRQLAALGVEAWRVDLLPLAPGNAQHLAQYALMDISLDPFPYAGTTTTTESLYMGVPTLTLAGRCHAHNVGVSLLTAVGLHPLRPRGSGGGGGTGGTPGSSGCGGGSVAPGLSLGGGSGGASGCPTSPASPADSGSPQSLSQGGSPVHQAPAAALQRQPPAGAAAAAGAFSGGSSLGGYGSGSCGGGVGGLPGTVGCGASWVARSEEEYVALAAAHAVDFQALADLRASLRGRMLASPMCDAPSFIRRLEGVYRGLWRRHCALMAGDAAAAAAAAQSVGIDLSRRRGT